MEGQAGPSLWRSNNHYPQFVYSENERLWGTNNEGKELYVYSHNQEVQTLNALLRPVNDLTIGTIEVENNDVWLGGNFGLIHWDATMKEPDYSKSPQVYVRRIVEAVFFTLCIFGNNYRILRIVSVATENLPKDVPYP